MLPLPQLCHCPGGIARYERIGHQKTPVTPCLTVEIANFIRGTQVALNEAKEPLTPHGLSTPSRGCIFSICRHDIRELVARPVSIDASETMRIRN
jgi:hypothetical protein